MTDNPSDLHDPTVPPTDEQWRADPPPTLEQDLAVLAWLQASHQLSGEATGYICGALLEWVLLGEPWPRDPAEPIAGPECDHLEALVQIAERWARYGTAVEIRAQRAATLDAAYAANPTRFTRRPQPPKLPTIAWINEPIEEVAQSA